MLSILNVSKFNFQYNGGIEREAKQVSKQLSELYYVETLCFGKANNEHQISLREKLIEFKSFRVLNKIDFSYHFIRHIIRNRNKYDIIWVHYPNIFPVLAILFLNTKARIIIHWHNDIQVLPLLYKLFKPFENKILKRSKIIVTTSPKYHKFSNALPPFESKIRCIHIRIDELPELINITSPKKIIKKVILTSIGRYTPYKGYDKLIDEISKNDNLFFNLISSTDLPPDLSKKIKRSSNIRILKNLSDEDVIQTLRNSSVYIMSSITRNEGYGIVLIEALRCGVPLCVNKIEGTGSEFIVKEGFNGEFFNIDEPLSMNKAIKQITHKKNYFKYRKGARKDFLERFNVQGVKEYQRIIKELV